MIFGMMLIVGEVDGDCKNKKPYTIFGLFDASKVFSIAGWLNRCSQNISRMRSFIDMIQIHFWYAFLDIINSWEFVQKKIHLHTHPFDKKRDRKRDGKRDWKKDFKRGKKSEVKEKEEIENTHFGVNLSSGWWHCESICVLCTPRRKGE